MAIDSSSVLREIVQTEQDYVSDLQILVNNYLEPLKAKQLLTADEAKIVFGNLSQVVDFQLMFSSELVATSQLPLSHQRVGACFMKHAEQFKCYTMYCANHSKALDLLNRLGTRNKFKEFERKVAVDLGGGDAGQRNLSLSSLVMKPVQRICKYPLLLKECRQATSSDHPDYEQLTSALSMMEELAEYINEMTRRMEDMQSMVELQQQIDGWQGLSLVGCGAMVRQGILAVAKEADMKSTKKYRECLVLLLAKRLVWCTKKSVTGRYQFKKAVDIVDLGITELEIAGLPLTWQIVDKSEWSEFVLRARTDVEKDEWVELMQNVIAGKIVPDKKKNRPTIGTLSDTKQPSGKKLGSRKTGGSIKRGKKLGATPSTPLSSMSIPFLTADAGSATDLCVPGNDLGSVSVPDFDGLVRSVVGGHADSPAETQSSITSPKDTLTLDSLDMGLHSPLSKTPSLTSAPSPKRQDSGAAHHTHTHTTRRQASAEHRRSRTHTPTDTHGTIPSHTSPRAHSPAPQSAWVCTGCLRQIKDVSLGQMVGDRAWHTQCMVCDTCGVTVGSGGVPVHRSGAALFCFQHKMSARKCRGCNTEIDLSSGGSRSALRVADSGDLWHVDCCKCHTCGSKFQNGSTLRVVDGSTYCEKHFAALSLTCAVCAVGLWTNESYVKRHGQVWHATCAPVEVLK